MQLFRNSFQLLTPQFYTQESVIFLSDCLILRDDLQYDYFSSVRSSQENYKVNRCG